METGSIPSRTVTGPAVLHELLGRNIDSVLDVGCGEGWLARELPSAIQYLGIDGSQELVQCARKKSARSFDCVTYEQIRTSLWTPDKTFDAIVFNFSLFEEHITDLLKTTARFLKPSGTILIQTLHPLSFSAYEDSWETEDFASFDSKNFCGPMKWYRRTLETWTLEFLNAGLITERILEPRHNQKVCSILFSLKKKL